MKKNTFVLLCIACLTSISACNQQRGINPLLRVAEYNVAPGGERFTASHSNDASGYFNWYQITGTHHINYNPKGENIVINFAGYHLPTLNEIKVIVPYDIEVSFEKDEDINNVSEDSITIGDITRSYTSDFRYPGGGVAYALRFKGHDNEQLCAYRYERVGPFEDGNLTSHMKVTCRYLGSKFSGTVGDIANEDFWISNNSKDVTRVFPICGYKWKDSDEIYFLGTLAGNYWSSTQHKVDSCGYAMMLDNSSAFIYYNGNAKVAGYAVRLFSK